MSKLKITKSQKRLFILLGIISAYALFDFATSKAKPATIPDNKISSAMEASANPVVPSGIIQSSDSPSQPGIIYSAWKRDPFRKNNEFGSKANLSQLVETLLIPKSGNFNLTAISRKGKKSYALINDQILSLGDQISGFKIVDIQANKVILKKNDFTFTLTLPEDEYNN